MKKFAASQLEVIIDTAQIEIKALEKQISISEELISELDVKTLRDKLND